MKMKKKKKNNVRNKKSNINLADTDEKHIWQKHNSLKKALVKQHGKT